MDPIKTVADLKNYYKRLPGVGDKTAERLAYATLGFPKDTIDGFVSTLKDVEEKVHACPECGIFIDTEKCPICSDPNRDSKTLLIVSDVKNVISFEKTGKYTGKYFVLGGSISLMKGNTPEKLRIPELKKKIVDESITEVIIACNSTVDGETTSLYIAQILSDVEVKVTRLAFGLPFGADLEYVDEETIARSLGARTVMRGKDQ